MDSINDLPPCRLAISNYPVRCHTHRNSRRSVFPFSSSESVHGLRNETATSMADPASSASENAISTYPTPGSTTPPSTMWCEKSASVEETSVPAAVCAPLSGHALSRRASGAVASWPRRGHSVASRVRRRRPRYSEAKSLALSSENMASLSAAPNAPCAMVPLKPNELRRDSTPRAARASASTGIWNGLEDTSDDRWMFSLEARFI